MSSILKVDQLQDSGGNAIITSDGSGNITTGTGMGKVLQVVSVTKSDTYAANAGLRTFFDITGLSLSITPSSTSNKILILATIMGNGSPSSSRLGFRLVRNSTAIGIGDEAGNRARLTTGPLYGGTSGRPIEATSINFLDTPSSTSSLTYKIQGYQTESTNTHFINRSSTDSNLADYARTISTITVMEISG